MRSKLNRIFAVAHLVLLDGLRRHALIGLVVLALALQCGGLLFIGFVPRDIGRASSDFIFSVSWLSGLVFLFFHAVQALAWGEERRVIHTLLARPISRAEYVVGVFSGLALLLLLLNLVLGSLGWGVLEMIQSVVHESFFREFSTGFFLLTWSGIYMVQLAVLSVIMLFSGLVRGSFTVLLMTISYYLTCNGLPVVRHSLSSGIYGNGPSPVMKSFLQVLTFFFPDFNRLDYKLYVIGNNTLPDAGLLLSQYGMLAAYTVLALVLASAVYRKRDLK